MDLNYIKHGLYSSWTKETSHESMKDEFSQSNKTAGQCAITSVLINELLGGDIIKANVSNYGINHYRNQINGEKLDLTYSQFNKGDPIFTNISIADKNMILSNTDTQNRFNILKSNFENFDNTLASIEEQIGTCLLCKELFHFDHNSIYFGDNCSLLFIGEAPARNGWRITGKARKDQKGNIIPSGKTLDKLLHKIGLGLHNITFVEAIKCFPEDRKHIKNAITNCSPFLKKQINTLNPNILITLGDAPTRSLLGNTYKQFSEVVGKKQCININNEEYILIPIYHPSPISPQSLKGNEPIFDFLNNELSSLIHN